MVKLLLMLLLPLVVEASSVLPLQLDDLVRKAGRIFVGRCVESSPDLDERLFPSIWSRYRILEPLKGVGPEEEILVKGYGLSGDSSCRPGDEALIFLYPESRYGFSSPVGLGQGRWVVTTDSEGRKKTGEMPLDEILSKIRNLSR